VPAAVNDDDPAGLELDPEAMRALTGAVVERVLAYLSAVGGQPASGVRGDEAERARALREPPPEAGAPIAELLDLFFEDCIPRSFHAAGPGYLAYVPGGGLYPAALADMLSGAVNRYTGVWAAAPLCVQLEANVLDWLRTWMGFGPDARGLLTTGGSMASFTAVVTARERLLGPALRDGVLYATSQTHHCIVKAARLAGVLPDRVRFVAVDTSLRMRVEALAEAVARDREARLRPFMVVSSAGTVNTGAVDPLAAIGDFCRREGLWHHVDGAYGGFFHLCDELRPVLAGLSEADSLALDPHKGLFLPYGTGALLVRDGEALRRAHAATAGYLPPLPEDDLYDPSQYGPELSRPFRGLRLWLPLKLFGVARFRAALREKHELAAWAAREIARTSGLRLVSDAVLSLCAFEADRPGWDAAARAAATRALVERVNARGRVMITGASLEDRWVGRICVLSFRTRREHVAHCVDALREEAAALGRS
jgi:aromatic-L-amino-acid decarboxylase